MSEIKVPENGLNAAWEAVAQKMRDNIDARNAAPVAELHIARVAVEAFCRWLSENPQVPSTEQYLEMIRSDRVPAVKDMFCNILEVWQRRMFLAPEPEIPKEIDDLLWDDTDKGPYYVEHNKAAIEAYRRGQRSKP